MDRQYAHQLLDQLDAGQFAAVSRLIEVMVDPVARALAAAPLDDEPVTEEDICRLREAQAEEQSGTPMEEFILEFGLTMEDLLRENARVSATVPD